MDRLRRLFGGNKPALPVYKNHTADLEEYSNELSQLVPKATASPAAPAGTVGGAGGSSSIQLVVSLTPCFIADVITGSVIVAHIPWLCSLALPATTSALLSLPPLQLSVQGMHCSACSTAVEAALRALPGVHNADVALLSNSATVRYSPAKTTEQELLDAVEGCGFEAAVVSSTVEGGTAAAGSAAGGSVAVKLRVEGMHCGACSSGGGPCLATNVTCLACC
jgi:Cu+-exporting ATPase